MLYSKAKRLKVENTIFAHVDRGVEANPVACIIVAIGEMNVPCSYSTNRLIFHVMYRDKERDGKYVMKYIDHLDLCNPDVYGVPDPKTIINTSRITYQKIV